VSGNDADLIREALPSLKDALPSFSTKRIFSIIIEPVCLNLQDENSLLTQITSNSAIIRLTKQNILFKGGVQVVSGDKSLITERLNLFTENSVMKADRHFILKTSEKKIEGNHITVDMFLNVVKDEIIRKPEDSNRSAS
jgi:lipopolysaccharide assembly outer membrane protein LptD (OstA)